MRELIEGVFTSTVAVCLRVRLLCQSGDGPAETYIRSAQHLPRAIPTLNSGDEPMPEDFSERHDLPPGLRTVSFATVVPLRVFSKTLSQQEIIITRAQF